jgi:hypothetical protein
MAKNGRREDAVGEEFIELRSGQWLAEQEALHVVTGQFAEQLPLGFGFDALGEMRRPKLQAMQAMA